MIRNQQVVGSTPTTGSNKINTNLHNLARRKLRMIAAAVTLETLRVPPNNRLEALKGDRKGQWSIRINDQWRICFEWQNESAYNVEITIIIKRSAKMRHLKNIHPGEVLQEEFLVPMGISVYRIAKETGLSPTRLGQIIRGNRGITVETAIKIGRFLNTGPEFWMNLQSLYDIEEAKRRYSKEVKTIYPYSQTNRTAEVACK
ncbi:MAG: HigA family addiction module antitoxin [Thermodesulfovibrionales bacterium]